MHSDGGRTRPIVLILAIAGLAMALSAAPALGRTDFQRIPGYSSPGTPAKYNKVGIIKIGSKKARNVLVLSPGTSASAAYFAPFARDLTARAKNWQVWSVERRENLLEDHSVVNRAKAGKASPRRLFDYYLGYITDPSVTDRYRPVALEDVAFARRWGMRTAVEDLRRVVKLARKRGGRVVMGGHSLGGTITTAYATWDFNGKAGAAGLDALVYLDGGSGNTPTTPEQATQTLQEIESGSPWLVFGGIPAPFAGLFNIVASTTVRNDPKGTSLLQTWPLLPANLKPPVPATNEAAYGYALDADTSPPGLAAAQVNAGRLATSGDPRGWDRAGELSPIQRVAAVFSGTGFKGLDGTAWYHPRRLSVDSGGVAAGNANPAQPVLDVRATHGDDLDRLRIYAFAASLGGQRVLDAAALLATQSGIPKRRLTLVDRSATYTHIDPLTASPRNAFVSTLAPFLRKVARR